MIAKIINPELGSYKSVNTDYDVSGPGLPVAIVKEPEDTNDRVWVLDAIQYSYSTEEDVTATVGGIDIEIGDRVKWSADISDFIGVYNLYIPGQTDKSITVTLKSGGLRVVGKLNCQWHLEPAAG